MPSNKLKVAPYQKRLGTTDISYTHNTYIHKVLYKYVLYDGSNRPLCDNVGPLHVCAWSNNLERASLRSEAPLKRCLQFSLSPAAVENCSFPLGLGHE